MSVEDLLGDKIKAAEISTETFIKDQPLVIRFDGNSFSKFTIDQKFTKPFDLLFQEAMVAATKALMSYCSEARFSYTQSDEITLVMYNSNPFASAFLSNRVQKICSIMSSVCTNGFNSYILEKTGEFPSAAFDCRVFPYALDDISEPFIWRQSDCFKNCVSSVLYWGLIQDKGLSNRAASKKMDELSTWQRIDMIESELGIKMSDYDPSFTRGVGMYKIAVEKSLADLPEDIKKFNEGKAFVIRKEIKVDKNLPLFKEDLDFVKKLVK